MVPIVVPDIPVIHRLFPIFFASPTRGRGAWCLGDRDGGPGLPKSRQRHEGAAGDQRSDLRRQAMERTFGFSSGPAGKRRRKRKLPLARRGSRVLRNSVSKAGRKSGYPKKGRETSAAFAGTFRSSDLKVPMAGRAGRKISEPSGGAVE